MDSCIALGRTIRAQYKVTCHNLGNQTVQVQGDFAWAEHYTSSSHRIPADAEGAERDFVANGRYVDLVEKRNGTWKFKHRQMVIDFTRTDPVAPAPDGIGVGRGSRNRNDFSYKAMERLESLKEK